MAKKRPKFNMEMETRGANRRLFARSQLVFDKLNESRQEFPRYKKDGSRAKKNWVKRECEVCHSWVPSSQIAIDHIDPVVPPEGFPTHLDMWERIIIFLKRLWCPFSNLQRICDTCHAIKSQSERISRLTLKYTEELDLLEKELEDGTSTFTSCKKQLAKYISKKKSIGLVTISERAQKLKDLYK